MLGGNKVTDGGGERCASLGWRISMGTGGVVLFGFGFFALAPKVGQCPEDTQKMSPTTTRGDRMTVNSPDDTGT